MKDKSLDIMNEEKIHGAHANNARVAEQIKIAREKSKEKKKRKIKNIKVAVVSTVAAVAFVGAIAWSSCVSTAVDIIHGVHRDKNGGTFDSNGNYVNISFSEYLHPSKEAIELAKKIMLGQVDVNKLYDEYTYLDNTSAKRGSL